MNYIKNDKGEMVIAVGAPGSLARLRCQYPKLQERVNALWMGQASPETAREECMGTGTFDSGYRLSLDEAMRFVLDCNYGPGASHD